jgi:hypothetical protein
MKDALWLLGSALVALAVAITAMIITLHITAPARTVQTRCTVTGWQ